MSHINGLIPVSARSKTIYGRNLLSTCCIHERHPPLSSMPRHAQTCLASPRRTASLEACRIQVRAVVASNSRRAWTTAVNTSPRLAGPPRSRRVVSKRALWLLASLSTHERSPLIRLSFYTKDLWPGRRRRRIACSNTFGIHGLRGAFSLVSDY